MKDILIDLYCNQNFSINQISKQLNTTWHTLKKNFILYNIPLKYADSGFQNSKNRKYTFNYLYFDNIDNSKKAYWLGFIIADGCVSTGNNNLLKIELSVEDYILLEQFAKDLECNSKIDIYTRKEQWKICRIRLYNKHLLESLSQYGVIPQKTYKPEINWNKIPIRYIPDVLRGWFDGDGTVKKNSINRKKPTISFGFSGHNKNLQEIQNILIEQLEINQVQIYCKNGDFGELVYSGNINCQKFYNYIYYNDNLFSLSRKKEFLKECFN
jgi:hypothetical protein